MLPTIFLLLLAQSVNRVDDVPNPRWQGNWVTDQAGVIETTASERLNAKIDELHRQIGIEIAVVTVDRVTGVPRDFAVELFNHWGIGSPETNNGLLIFLAVAQRRLEIVTGIGLEDVLTNSWLEQMQEAEMVPLFRSGMFGSGLESGLAAIEERLLEAPAEAASAAAPSSEPAASQSALPGPTEPTASTLLTSPPSLFARFKWVLWAMLGGLAAAGAWLGKRFFQTLQRRCDACGVPMILLDEVADDQHLEKGQRKEEELGSLDYDVFICGACQKTRIIQRWKWFSGYRRCPSCGYKTNKRTSRTRVHATRTHGGEVEIREKCSNCTYGSSTIRYTAKRSDYASSSGRRSFFSSSGGFRSSFGSSRSSFGGGRSRGGGSGSSW